MIAANGPSFRSPRQQSFSQSQPLAHDRRHQYTSRTINGSRLNVVDADGRAIVVHQGFRRQEDDARDDAYEVNDVHRPTCSLPAIQHFRYPMSRSADRIHQQATTLSDRQGTLQVDNGHSLPLTRESRRTAQQLWTYHHRPPGISECTIPVQWSHRNSEEGRLRNIPRFTGNIWAHSEADISIQSNNRHLPSQTVQVQPQRVKRSYSHLPMQQHLPIKKAKGFDKLDLLCSATLDIGPLSDNPAGCSCPKSKCIALYCDCFKAGRRCRDSICSCLDCKNTVAESGIDGARSKAIRCILARNPRAFTNAGLGNMHQKLPPGEIACNCIRSRCLKLYCTCFQSGRPCSKGLCTCIQCLNLDDDSEGHRRDAVQSCLQKRPDAFKTRIKETGLGCACKNNRCIRKYCECFRTQLVCSSRCSCRDCENNGGTL